MRGIIRKIINTCLLMIIVLIFMENRGYAKVDINALEGYLNGVVTQQQTNQSNNPKYSSRGNSAEIVDPITGNLILQETDIILSGKDGLDLKIGRTYNSSQDEYDKKVNVTSTSDSYTQVVSGYVVYVLVYDENSDQLSQMTIGTYSDSQEAQDVFNYYKSDVKNCIPLGVVYQTSVTYYDNYLITTSNYPDKYNYFKTRYNLGAGWSFSFPSVQIEEEKGIKHMYFHDGNGDTYKITENRDEDSSNLEGYQGKDVKFLDDNGSYINKDKISSKYKYINCDKTTTYFAADGRLLGIKDRFGNEIKFSHMDKKIYEKSYPLISQIEDSVGRVVTFTYKDNSVEMKIEAPKEKENIKFTYEQKYCKKKIEYKDGTIKDTYEYPVLNRVIDPIGRITTYEPYYEKETSLPKESFSYCTKKDITDSSTVDRYLLGAVICGGVKNCFEYEKTVRNLGVEGATEAYRVKSRYDKMAKRDRSDQSSYNWKGMHNRVDYTYHGDCTGYPEYTSDEFVKDSYQFGSEAINSNGMKTKYLFNGTKQLIQQDIIASNNEKKTTKNLEFDGNYKFKPTKTEVTEYASDGTLASTLYSEISYTDWGGIKSSTLPLTLSQYDNAEIKEKYTTTFSYDNCDYPYSVTNKLWYQNEETQLMETYNYDSLGRVLFFINSKNDFISYDYYTDSDNNQVREIDQFLDDGKTKKIKIVYGNETGYAYPKEENTYYWDENGQYQEKKLSRTYNMLWGLVETEIDSENRVTSYKYDGIGRVKQKQTPDFINKSYDENYSVTEDYIYEEGFNIGYAEDNECIYGTTVATYISYVNKDSGLKSFYNIKSDFYDSYGNLRLKESSCDSKWNIDETITYDNMMRVTSCEDAKGNITKVSYSPWGEVNESIDKNGNLYVNDYDVKSKKAVSYFVEKANISPYREDTKSNTYKEDYIEVYLDQFGRVTERKVYEQWPDLCGELSELYKYDIVGNLIGYIDPKRNLNEEGYTKTYEYDELNQVVRVKDAENQVTKVKYTTLGSVASIEIQDNTDCATLFKKSYNELGDMISKSDSSGQATEHFYNSIGLVTKSRDRNMSTITQSYDQQNQLVTIDHKKNDGDSNHYEYSYRDPFGYFEEILYENGILKSYEHYYRNDKGEITQKNVFTAHIDSNLKMRYDVNGDITSIGVGTFDKNYFYSNYQYTKDRLTKVQTNGLEEESSSEKDNAKYEYYPNGQLKKITYPQLNDDTFLTTEYTYNSLGKMTTVVSKKDSTVLSKFMYSYDKNGNIVSIDDSISIKNYVYDKLNRLIEIQSEEGNKITYSYDLRGNRISEQGVSFEIEDTTYVYDVENKLRIVSKGTKETKETRGAVMEYYADGLRAEKNTVTGSAVYVYDLSHHLVAEVEGKETKANYVWGPDRVLVKKEASGGEYYYIYNGHGDVIQVVDKNGKIVNNYKYDEWGNILEANETVHNPFRYAGEVYDEETGLYYLRARYYDPKIGRFLTEDSIEGQIDNPLSLNLYAYCHNNPIMFTDPSGHIIQLAGTHKEREKILENLQMLTDHTLDLDKKGKVYVSTYSSEIDFHKGNTLITRMINRSNTCTIKLTKSGGNFERDIDIKKAINGIGSDTLVYFDPSASPNILTVDPSTGNVSGATRPIYIGLAHELIHAERSMRGAAIGYSKTVKYKYQIDVVYVKGFLLFSSYWNIIYSTQKVPKEELATVGLRYNGWNDITENDIRAEHGLNLRGAY